MRRHQRSDRSRPLALRAALALLACGLTASASDAAVRVAVTGGSGAITSQTITYGPSGAVVRCTVSAGSAANVVVETDSAVEIDSIEIECNRADANAAGVVYLTVRQQPGTAGKLTRVGSVKPVSLDTMLDAELVIESIETSKTAGGMGGNIGVAGTARGGLIKANQVMNLVAAGNLTADVHATGRTGAATLDIARLETRGRLLGQVWCLKGYMGLVVADLGIGAVGAMDAGTAEPQTVVFAREGIREIRAADVHGAIVAGYEGTPRGNIQRLDVAGNFAGTLWCGALAPTDESFPARGLSVGGDMAGSMFFERATIAPVQIGGQLAGTFETGSVASHQPSTDPNRRTDIALGGLPVGGEFLCHGSMAGPITLASHLDGDLIIGADGAGNLGASVSVNGRINGLFSVGGSINTGRKLTAMAELSSTGAILVGKSLMGSIELPTIGLQGVVLINFRHGLNDASGTTAGPGTWTGTVRVGSIVQTNPPDGVHSATTLQLGGGVLALVPYRLATDQCSPTHEHLTPLDGRFFTPHAGQDEALIVMRSYGPMKLAEGVESWQDAVKIERRIGSEELINQTGNPPPAACEWESASHLFDVRITDPDDPRVLVMQTSGVGFPPTGEYRVVPTGILSALTPTEPPVKWASTCDAERGYVFRVKIDCPTPPVEPQEPPTEPKDPPTDPKDPPKDPPTDPVDPPKDPPTDPVDPPKDPPTDPVDPPKDPPKDPPTDPVDPPKDPPKDPDDPILPDITPKDPPTDPKDPPKDPPTDPKDPGDPILPDITPQGQGTTGPIPDSDGDGIPDPCEVQEPEPCPCERTADGMLDLADMVDFLNVWLPNIGSTVSAGQSGDFNADGMVDLADLVEFLNCWLPSAGQECP